LEESEVLGSGHQWPRKENEEEYVFIVLFGILLLAWLGGFFVFHVSSALIHLLLLFAVISLIAHLFRRNTAS
jgi:uncharacterized membrane protein YfcA